MKQKALITGASSGIGLALAHVMAEQGHDLVLVSRNEDALEKIAKELIKQYKISVEFLATDLSVPGAGKYVYEQLKNKGIEILVNNAGAGLVGDFLHTDSEKNTSIMNLNMTTLVELTHCFGNSFMHQGRGKILNLGSIASFFPGPKQPVYFATKAFVRSFSRALAYTLKGSGVTVTVLHPGVTNTQFFKSAEAQVKEQGASPRSVAMLGYNAMMRGKIEATHGLLNILLTSVFARLPPYSLQPWIVDKTSDV